MRYSFLPVSLLLTIGLAYQVASQTVHKSQGKSIDILTGNTPEQREQALRKLDFVKTTVVQVVSSVDSSESVLHFESAQPAFTLYLTTEELHQTSRRNIDPIGEEIRRRYLDVPPTLPLFAAFFLGNRQRVQKKQPLQLPIPTELEVDILRILWQHPGWSSSELYARLDTIVNTTSEDLQETLSDMTRRGLLARKKISRANEFSLFGITEIELSSYNRKNSLYVYWPAVTKERLITYLDSRITLSGASGHENEELRNQEDAKERLLRLVR